MPTPSGRTWSTASRRSPRQLSTTSPVRADPRHSPDWHAVEVLDAVTLAEVERVIRAVARDEILPYFGGLESGHIAEKAPGDLVTVADRAAEEALTEALSRLVPGSVVVGEEAVADDPATLRRLGGDAPVWVVDPVDGTH